MRHNICLVHFEKDAQVNPHLFLEALLELVDLWAWLPQSSDLNTKFGARQTSTLNVANTTCWPHADSNTAVTSTDPSIDATKLMTATCRACEYNSLSDLADPTRCSLERKTKSQSLRHLNKGAAGAQGQAGPSRQRQQVDSPRRQVLAQLPGSYGVARRHRLVQDLLLLQVDLTTMQAGLLVKCHGEPGTLAITAAAAAAAAAYVSPGSNPGQAP